MGDWSALNALGPVAVAAIHLRAADERGVIRCTYCRSAARRGGDRQIDHVVPRRRGGLDVASNLVLACRRCNAGRVHDELPLRARLAGRTLAQVRADVRRQTSIPIGPGAEIHARAVAAAWQWWPAQMARRARARAAHVERRERGEAHDVFAFFGGLAA